MVAANDAFAARVTLTGLAGVLEYDYEGATTEVDEPIGYQSLWYSWTAPSAAVMHFHTQAPSGDTALAVYTGTTLTGLGLVVANDDDSVPANVTDSAVSFTPSSGTTYAIRVSSRAGGEVAPQSLGYLAWHLESSFLSVDTLTFTAGDGSTLSTLNTLRAASDAGRAGRIVFSGQCVLTGDPIEDPPPADRPKFRRISEVMPTPSLDSFGRPINWTPTSVTNTEWGRIQVVVGGKDVTYLRGVTCEPPSWVKTEPFADATAVLRFPQISSFDVLGSGSLAMFHDWAPVELAVIRPDNSRHVLWDGSLMSLEDSVAPGGNATEFHAIGANYRADFFLKPPPFDDPVTDVGYLIADALNDKIHNFGLALRSVSRVRAGIIGRDHGSWNPLLTGYVQDLLSTAYREDGVQLTVSLIRPRQPWIRWKDLTTVRWTVTCGQRGVEHGLSRDLSMSFNVIYGEGTDPENCHWRNAKYPHLHDDTAPLYPLTLPGVYSPGDADTDFQPFADLLRRNGYPMISGDTYLATDESVVRDFQGDAGILVDGVVGPQTWAAAFMPGSNEGDLSGAFFWPLAADRDVMPFYINAQGGSTGPNAAYNPAKARIEHFENFGDRIRKSEAHFSANVELLREREPGYLGDITLHADPQEGSRFEIEPGDNILLKRHRGVNRILHIASVDADLKTGVVRLTVDERARDVMTIAAIRQRARDTRDPAGRQRPTYRNSKQIEDRIAVWDCENGSGVIPKFAVYGGLWSVIHIPTAGRGTIVRTEITTSGPPSAFAIAVFDRPITSNQVKNLIGTPFAYDAGINPWDSETLNTYGLIMAWGGPDQAAGYYPHPQTDSTGALLPVTGRMVDDASWYFESQRPPWLWVAVYSPNACYVEGRLFPGTDT